MTCANWCNCCQLASFRPQKDHEISPKVRKCKNPRCGTCPHIEKHKKLFGIATKFENSN